MYDRFLYLVRTFRFLERDWHAVPKRNKGQDLDLEDEAALDPEDMFGFDLPDDTPISMLAPSARVRVEHPNQLRERLECSDGDVPAQSGPPQNTATGVAPPDNTATGVVPTVDTTMTEPVTASHGTVEEPAAKRQKMTISAIGHFRFPHVDDTEATMGRTLACTCGKNLACTCAWYLAFTCV